MTDLSQGDRADDVVFPIDLDDLTPDVLGAALAERMPGVVVDHVEVVAAKHAGDGVASTADRVVVDLTYAPGTGGDLPGRLILKTMLASPHAPHAMYENEVRFYGEIRDDLDDRGAAGLRQPLRPPHRPLRAAARGPHRTRRALPLRPRPGEPHRGALAAREPRDAARPLLGQPPLRRRPVLGAHPDQRRHVHHLRHDRPRADRGPGGAPPLQGRADRTARAAPWPRCGSRSGSSSDSTPSRPPPCCTATRTSGTPTCCPASAAGCSTGS